MPRVSQSFVDIGVTYRPAPWEKFLDGDFHLKYRAGIYTYVWARIDHALALRILRFIVLPRPVYPPVNPTFLIKCRTFLMGAWRSRLVPWNKASNDQIWNKLLPHNHTVYMWLIRVFLDTFRSWDYLLISVWRDIPLGDSVLWVIVPSITGAGISTSQALRKPSSSVHGLMLLSTEETSFLFSSHMFSVSVLRVSATKVYYIWF
jgi:hypothetical protein